MALALLATVIATAAAADFATAPATCYIHNGTYVDRTGNVATLAIAGDGVSVTATSVYGATGWVTASGKLTSNTSLYLEFGGNAVAATAQTDCSLLAFDNESVWSFVGLGSPNVSHVHYVFQTHLDLGFTDTARGVCDLYFNRWLPQSIALAQQMRARGGEARFALTSHPALIAEFLDGAAGCAHAQPNASARADMRAAITRGDVMWHGKFGNLFPELMDGAGFASSLREADRLNAQFGTAYGATTVKSTDVPGLSRSVIPILRAAGRRAVHMGYNSACRMAAIPQSFMWTHPESGGSLLAMANNNYGSTIVVPPHALVWKYQSDNTGPPTPTEVDAFVASLHAAWPGASVALSSLDAFAAAVLASPAAASLPTLSSEVGDSWTYGAPADPAKLGRYRETRRAIADALAAGAFPAEDPQLTAFERRIAIGGPEHNWGLSIGQYLPGARTAGGTWSNAGFHAVRGRADYAFVEAGWAEKRAFLDPLPPPAPTPAWSEFLANLTARVDALLPRGPPDVSPSSGFVRIANPAAPTVCGKVTVAFDPADGSIISLVNTSNGYNWALPGEGDSYLDEWEQLC